MSSWVNPKIAVGDAGTKGRGLFAKEFIKKDEIVVVSGGRIVANSLMDQSPYREFRNICFQIEKGFCLCPAELDKNKIDGYFMTNHSCEPNCGQRGPICVVAMRDIEPGEEITCDYAMTDADYEGDESIPQEPMVCLCGAPTCRKIITGEDWKRKDLQEKYKGYFSPYIEDLIDLQNLKSRASNAK